MVLELQRDVGHHSGAIMRTATPNSRNEKRAKKIGVAAQGSTMDGELVDRWDLGAFEESLGRCEAKAYRLAVQLVCCEPAAQEIVQETFLAAWQNMHRFASRSEIETWVYRATVKAALGRLDCAKGRRQPFDDHCLLFMMTARKFWMRTSSDEKLDWLADFRPSPHRSIEIYRRVRKIVDSLPKGLRAVFILCDLEDMSVGELAEILDSPSEEVKEKLQAARLAVRDAIVPHCACAARKVDPGSIDPGASPSRETANVQSIGVDT